MKAIRTRLFHVGVHALFDSVVWTTESGNKRYGRNYRDREEPEDNAAHTELRTAMLNYLKSRCDDYQLLLKIVDGDPTVTYRKLADEFKSNPGTVFKQKKSYFKALLQTWVNPSN